jgi:hypothetical protein
MPLITFLALLESWQPKEGKTKFAAGITCNNALDSALLYVKDGFGFDSSWRHLNHSGCPATLLVMVNEFQRVVPGKSGASSHIRTFYSL